MADDAQLRMLTANEAITVIAAALDVTEVAQPPIVLIDGRSGAGKSTLANLVRKRVPWAQIIRLDDIYPGWDGLAAAREHLQRHVLDPLAEGRVARWPRWDWQSDAVGEWVTVDSAAPMIVEGVGAVSAASRSSAQLAVWVELDSRSRKKRALARDGDRFAPHWHSWARLESAFIEREHPREHSDAIVDGRTIAG